jgi:hypothetical protein
MWLLSLLLLKPLDLITVLPELIDGKALFIPRFDRFKTEI